MPLPIYRLFIGDSFMVGVVLFAAMVCDVFLCLSRYCLLLCYFAVK